MRHTWIGLVCALLLLHCTPKRFSADEMQRAMSDPESGLARVRQANGCKLTASYLPPEWLALRDTRRTGNAGPAAYDSLLAYHRGSHAFLLTIEPEGKSAATDILYEGIATYPEYKDRILQLNFRLADLIYLDTGLEKRPPVLHTLENTYGLRPGRSVYLVFEAGPDHRLPPDQAPKQLDLVFNDLIFNTGINHFSFRTPDILQFKSLASSIR